MSYVNINKINKFIKDNKLTKTQFCKQCGISKSTLYVILKEKGNFFLTSLYKIAIGMNCHLVDLVKAKKVK
ncbi:MAG: helix-turn-helix transcriptional regulator [Clostridiales bacterium]|nr:helix-turn-helix transcriptional regulator [Clostridiales bacterium]